MQSIFTYPLNSGTGYIDPDYYGGTGAGFFKRIQDLKNGNYLPWGGLTPTATVADLINEISLFHEYYNDLNGTENVKIHDFWQYPLITVTKTLHHADISSATAAVPCVFTSTGDHHFPDQYGQVTMSNFDGSLAYYTGQRFYVQKLSSTTFNLSYDFAGSNLLGITSQIVDDFSAFDLDESETTSIKMDIAPYQNIPNQSQITINSVGFNGEELVGNTYYMKQSSGTIYELYEDSALTNPLTHTEITPFDANEFSYLTKFTAGSPGIFDTPVGETSLGGTLYSLLWALNVGLGVPPDTDGTSGLSDNELMFWMKAANQEDSTITADDMYYLKRISGDADDFEIYLDQARTVPLDLSHYNFDVDVKTSAITSTVFYKDWTMNYVNQVGIETSVYTGKLNRAWVEAEKFQSADATATFNPYLNPYQGKTHMYDYTSTDGTTELFDVLVYDHATTSFIKNQNLNVAVETKVHLDALTVSYTEHTSGNPLLNNQIIIDKTDLPNEDFYLAEDVVTTPAPPFTSTAPTAGQIFYVPVIVYPGDHAVFLDAEGNQTTEGRTIASVEYNTNTSSYTKTNFGSADGLVCMLQVQADYDAPGSNAANYRLYMANRDNTGQLSIGSAITEALIEEATGDTLSGTLKIAVLHHSIAYDFACFISTLSGGTADPEYIYHRYWATPTFTTVDNYFENNVQVGFANTRTVNATIGITPVDSTTGDVDPHSTNPNKYKLNNFGTYIGGNEVYQYLSAADTYTPGAKINLTKYFSKGDDQPTLLSESLEQQGQVAVTVDGSGYFSSMDHVSGGHRGAYADNDHITLYIENADDTYTPTPLSAAQQQDVWDTHDKWADTGVNDGLKKWPTTVAPRSIKWIHDLPTSSTVSQNGRKYVRGSGYQKLRLEVEYPPMTRVQFEEYLGVAQAMQGQYHPVYFELKYNNQYLLPVAKTQVDGLRLLEDVNAGDKILMLQGFDSNVNYISNGYDAITAGEMLSLGTERNAGVVASVQDQASNVFGEVKFRISHPLNESYTVPQRIYNRPDYLVVSMDTDGFQYQADINQYYYVSVTFEADQWKGS